MRAALVKAWAAWDFGMRNRTAFAARSFAMIALGVVCDMVERLDKLEADGASKSDGDSDAGSW